MKPFRFLEKTCPAAGYQQIEHGRVQCTDERRFGTRCMYICNAGYELQRPALHDSTMAVINCTANGTWDMEPPVCVPSQCSPTVQELRQVGDKLQKRLLKRLTVHIVTIIGILTIKNFKL